MSLQKVIYLSGKVENLVFYERLGTFIARTVPDEVIQTDATKMRSRNFGIASKAGKILRDLLSPSLTYAQDKKMQGRFSGAISKWLGQSSLQDLQPVSELPWLAHFNFSDCPGIAERVWLPLTVSQPSWQMIQVDVPAFSPRESISAPAGTVFIECSLAAASCKLKEGTVAGKHIVKFRIPYNDMIQEAQTILFPVPIDPGNLVVTVMSLEYMVNELKRINLPAFRPSSVIDARYG